jgi:hypothetical protein
MEFWHNGKDGHSPISAGQAAQEERSKGLAKSGIGLVLAVVFSIQRRNNIVSFYAYE